MRSIHASRLFAALAVTTTLAACGAAGSLPVSGPSLPPASNGAIPPVQGGGTAQDATALVGSWKALSVSPAGHKVSTIAEPDRFTAEFRADGTLALLAECNRCTGGYTAAPGTLKTTPMACTLAACASAPLDTQFSGLVNSATTWAVSGSQLELASGAGTVRLRR